MLLRGIYFAICLADDMAETEEAPKKEQVSMEKETAKAEQVLAEEEPKKEKVLETCTEQKVQHWFEDAAEMFNISITEVSNLKCLNYKALNILKKEDWLRRSPNFGDILFNMWQEDRGAITKEKDEGKYLTKILNIHNKQ